MNPRSRLLASACGGAVLLCTAAISDFACTSDDCVCSPYACQSLSIAIDSATSADGHITLDGQDLPLTPSDDSNAIPAEGSCFAMLQPSESSRPRGEAPPQPTQAFWVVCELDGLRLAFDSAETDFRDLSVGQQEILMSGFVENGVDDSAIHNDSDCGAVLFDAITVEVSKGGSEAYPQVVTEDYDKVIRLKFSQSCHFPTSSDPLIAFDVDLRFETTRVDITANPNDTCNDCLC